MNLNEDLTLRILMLNASDHSMNVKDRLVTARRSSQVCREWRDVIIGYSPLWARLILINDFLDVRWMKEVIRRAGLSLMWVKADLLLTGDLEKRNMVLSLFLGLITSRWDHVESLELEIQQRLGQQDSDRLWSSLSKSAPVLRSFELSVLPRVHESIFRSDAVSLMIQAPLLHTFSCEMHHIPISSSWLRGLTTLEFTPYSTKHALDIISSTPKLESLKLFFNISHDRNSGLDEELIYISLPPRLSSFHAVTTFKGFVDFWRNITLPPLRTPCTIFHGVSLQPSDLLDTVTSISTTARIEAMSRLVQFHSHSSSSEEKTKLYMELTTHDATIELQPYLRIIFATTYGIQFPDRFMPFFNDLLTTHFTRSTHLTFGYNLDDSLDIKSLLPWLLSLTSVEDISFRSERGLPFIRVLDNAIQFAHPGRIIFPNLRTMKFVIRLLSDMDFISLMTFIQTRNITNHSLEAIHIETTVDIAHLIRPSIMSFRPVDLILIDISTGEKMGGGSKGKDLILNDISTGEKMGGGSDVKDLVLSDISTGEKMSGGSKVKVSIWKRAKAKLRGPIL